MPSVTPCTPPVGMAIWMRPSDMPPDPGMSKPGIAIGERPPPTMPSTGARIAWSDAPMSAGLFESRLLLVTTMFAVCSMPSRGRRPPVSGSRFTPTVRSVVRVMKRT